MAKDDYFVLVDHLRINWTNKITQTCYYTFMRNKKDSPVK